MTDVEKRLHEADLAALNNLRLATYHQRFSALRSLQTINGAGIVALLALLGQLLNHSAPYWLFVASGCICMIVGLILSIFANFHLPWLLEIEYRKNESLSSIKSCRNATRMYMCLVGFSMLFFLIGSLVVVLGTMYIQVN